MLDAQVSIDGGVTGSSSQVLAFSVGNMLAISLDIAFSESEVDDENFVAGFVEAYTEVVRFDISVNKMPVVDVLNSSDHLVDQHQHSLEGELPEGVFEEAFEGRAHKVHDEDIVVA